MLNAMSPLKSVVVLLSSVAIPGLLVEAQAQQGPGASGAYVAPQWPGDPYSLGVYTQVVDLNRFGGGGAAYVAVAPNPGWGGRPRPFLGLRITYLVPGGAAQRAGLEVGDIIVEANGRRTASVGALRSAIRNSNGFLRLKVRNVRPPHDFVPVPVYLAGSPGFPVGQPAAVPY